MEYNSGTYQLFISINEDIFIKIGKLGSFRLLAGNYIYTGSAMKNMKQRVDRHLRKDKKIKWHIDYLLNDPHVIIKNTKLYPSMLKQECIINKETITEFDAQIPIMKLGSSDCKNCPSHLIKI